MGRPPLSIVIAPKDQRMLAKLLRVGTQQVRVVIRALALLQLAKGASAPQIANVVPLTSQAIRNIGCCFSLRKSASSVVQVSERSLLKLLSLHQFQLWSGWISR